MGKGGQPESKKEQAAAARAEFQRRKRQQAIIMRVVGIAVVLAAAGGIGMCVIRDRNLTAAISTSTYPAGVHRSGQIVYAETPPVGGAHNVTWQNCGVYDAAIHEEHAVHSMEHGAVWITYQPGLSQDQITALQVIARDDYMLLSPFPGLPAPIVASTWNHQLRLDRADDARLRGFIARYKNNPSTTPEFGASCAGGVSGPATVDTLGGTSAPMPR